MIRRAGALFAAFLALSCASTSQHHLNVSVAELRQPGHPLPVIGTHFYIIRVRNSGSEPITVHTITVAPGGMTELDVENATQTFDETVVPEQEARFDMTIDVLVSRAIAGTISDSIQSLRVTIGGQGANGAFVETGDYTVGVEQRGD